MSNIKQYDPVIYPRKLWVAIQPTYEQISSMFLHHNKELSREKFGDLGHDCAITVNLITEKSTGLYGTLVIILKEEIGIRTISHEAYHVLNGIMTDLGEEPCGDLEQNAYFLGWVAEKIQESLVNKK